MASAVDIVSDSQTELGPLPVVDAKVPTRMRSRASLIQPRLNTAATIPCGPLGVTRAQILRVPSSGSTLHATVHSEQQKSVILTPAKQRRALCLEFLCGSAGLAARLDDYKFNAIGVHQISFSLIWRPCLANCLLNALLRIVDSPGVDLPYLTARRLAIERNVFQIVC